MGNACVGGFVTWVAKTFRDENRLMSFLDRAKRFTQTARNFLAIAPLALSASANAANLTFDPPPNDVGGFWFYVVPARRSARYIRRRTSAAREWNSGNLAFCGEAINNFGPIPGF